MITKNQLILGAAGVLLAIASLALISIGIMESAKVALGVTTFVAVVWALILWGFWMGAPRGGY